MNGVGGPAWHSPLERSWGLPRNERQLPQAAFSPAIRMIFPLLVTLDTIGVGPLGGPQREPRLGRAEVGVDPADQRPAAGLLRQRAVGPVLGPGEHAPEGPEVL